MADHDKLASGLTFHSRAYWSLWELEKGTANSTGGSYTISPVVKLREDGEAIFDADDYTKKWWQKGLGMVSDLETTFKNNRASVISSLNSWLLDVASEELDNPQAYPSAQQVLDYLAETMVSGAETLTRSDVSVGAVTLNLANSTASGSFVTTGSGKIGSRGSGLFDNQLILNGNLFRLECSSASTAGQEQFGVTCSVVSAGANPVATITVLKADSQTASGVTFSHTPGKTLVVDGDFTSALSGTGDTVGAYWSDTASGAADFTNASGTTWRSAGLMLIASGAGSATTFIGQTFQDMGNLNPLDLLCCTFIYKATAGSTGTMTITAWGTGYSAPSGQTWTSDTSSASQVWSRGSFFFTAPRLIPDDFGIKIQAASLDSKFYIDELIIAPPSVLQGVSMLMARDYPDHEVGDELTFSTTSDRAGKVAEMLAREYNVNMPVSASPTYPDA